MARPALGLPLSLGPSVLRLRHVKIRSQNAQRSTLDDSCANIFSQIHKCGQSAPCQPLRSCGKIVSKCPRPDEANCWNCRDVVNCTDQFFCEHCHIIQPPAERQNMFEYLGLPVSFEIEESLLKKRFRELQSAVHPDRFARASKHEKEISDEHSRKLNESYKTLSEPFLRAKYLLRLLGESDSTKKDLDSASLMEMMEWNERVAEMKKERELNAEKISVQSEIDAILKELGKQFTERSIDGVRNNITRLSYLYSLRNLIDKKLESMMGM